MTEPNPPAPAPAAPMSSHKAWAAGIGAMLLPLVAQALLTSKAAGTVLFHAAVCGWLGSACPAPDAVADAMLQLGSAVAGGCLTGFITYYVANKTKEPSP